MAAVKTLSGAIVNAGGSPLPAVPVTLMNDDSGATLGATTTNADGEWTFASLDETIRYRTEAAIGGPAEQVAVRKPASVEFDHLYVNTSLRTAAGATVALGGAMTIAGSPVITEASGDTRYVNVGGDTMTGGLTVSAGGIAVTGNSTITGTLTGLTGLTVASGGATINGTLTLPTATTIVELGSTSGANTPGLDFHSSGNAIDYDSRILASGGTGVVGNGTLTLTAATVAVSSALTAATLSVNSRAVALAGCRVYHNAAQSIATGTPTALSMNTERYDTDGFHDTVTNNTRLTVPAGLAGKYHIAGSLAWAAASDATNRRAQIRLNGTTNIAVSGGPAVNSASEITFQCVSHTYDLAVGDYVELVAVQASAGAVNVNAAGNYSPEFGMSRIGA